MLSWLEFAVGIFIWCAVMWDGFATIVLPRTVAPTRRLSGWYFRGTWCVWLAVARKIRHPELILSFVAVYGPLSVVLLLTVWASLIIVAFALIHQSLWLPLPSTGPGGFGALLYMSGSTFLTLGLGDGTPPDSIARFFILHEAATGYIFLALVITYMPVLDQAYSAREVGNLRIHSRIGPTPTAINLIRRYSGDDRWQILLEDLRDAEGWIAQVLQSHLSHPVLSFYRRITGANRGWSRSRP